MLASGSSTIVFNKKSRLAYIKDCALYFVTHGEGDLSKTHACVENYVPSVSNPIRKDTLLPTAKDPRHLHQHTANSGSDPEPSPVEEELL